MIKVLHVFNVMDRGGAEAMIMNLYRYINRKNVQFGFIVHQEREGEYDSEIIELGGEIFRVPQFCGYNMKAYKKAFQSIFMEHSEYAIVHGHMQSTAAIYLKEAKKLGRITIAHSHNTSSGRGFKAMLKTILQYPIRFRADYMFACSKAAGKWLYGKNKMSQNSVKVIYNAIDIDRYRFDAEVRNKIRKQQGLDGKIVIGHVGRFTYQKNHEFLIKVFQMFQEKHGSAILLLIGNGESEEKIRNLVKYSGLENSVKFLGVQDNVYEWIQAMDLFLFPSRYEGLPVTLIEAQTCGVPCVISDNITDEAILYKVAKVSLKSDVNEWVHVMEESLKINVSRSEGEAVIKNTNYNIKNAAAQIENVYCNMIIKK